MMTLTINEGILIIKTSMTGSNNRNKPYKEKNHNYIPTFNIKQIITKSIDTTLNGNEANLSITEFNHYVKTIRLFINHICQKTKMPQRKIWNSIFDYGLITDRQSIKRKVLAYYGNGEIKCVRCGMTDIRTLSIDHINGGGTQHTKELRRLGNTLYKWLVFNDYPKGFQTLCMNCQWIKKEENNENTHKHKPITADPTNVQKNPTTSQSPPTSRKQDA